MIWDEIAIFLHRWQNLAGAIVGGVFSLGVALLVSYLARNREDRAAAMILTAAFVSINARHSTLERLAKERAISAADLHKWLAEKLVQSRPKLSSGFEGALARLLLVHARLAVHLELFRTLYPKWMKSSIELMRTTSTFTSTGKYCGLSTLWSRLQAGFRFVRCCGTTCQLCRAFAWTFCVCPPSQLACVEI
jgi:hypothetical protein